MTYYNPRSRRNDDALDDDLNDDLETEIDTEIEAGRVVDVPAASVSQPSQSRDQSRDDRPRRRPEGARQATQRDQASQQRDSSTANSGARTRPSGSRASSSRAGGAATSTQTPVRVPEPRPRDSNRAEPPPPRNYSGGGGYGGGGYGGGGGGNYGYAPRNEGKRRFNASGLTVIIAIALISFFGGFALRDVFTATSGFDDERPIQAEQVPANLREFCVSYNGYPSFTLINVSTTSALTATTVPVLRLNTCTIPVKETANALQALGVAERSISVGLQLGGSNLTLVNLPLADTLARQFYARYPAIQESVAGATAEDRIATLEDEIAAILTDDVAGLALQNLIRTNQPNVYAIAPGHTLNLQPNIGRDFAQ